MILFMTLLENECCMTTKNDYKEWLENMTRVEIIVGDAQHDWI